MRPLLIEHCYECHSGDSEELQASLRVDGRAALITGGESGPALVPERPGESLLIEAVRYETYEMPPDGKLSDEQISTLTRWVELGAPWPAGEDLPDSFRNSVQIDWGSVRDEHWGVAAGGLSDAPGCQSAGVAT